MLASIISFVAEQSDQDRWDNTIALGEGVLWLILTYYHAV